MIPMSYNTLGADEEVRGVGAATLYITTRERNAWHGYESRQYRGPASLTSTFERAKQVAEGWRAQGSGFSIQQVPALIITSQTWRVALTEFHSNNSFAKWTGAYAGILQHGWELRHTLDMLGPNAQPGSWEGGAPDPNSFVSGLLEWDEEPERLRRKFKAWSSFSHGGRYMLGWYEKDGRHKSDGVRKVLERYADVNESPTPDEVDKT